MNAANPIPTFREKDARRYAALCVIIAAAALLRFAALGDAPAGIYQDEAANGLDALGVLEGNTPLYFAANNGREPVYIYLAALSVGVFGPTAFALRLPAAFLGVLTVPAAYALGRAWFGRRVGLAAAALLAGMFWHVHLSRIAFRAVALPCLAALALALGAHGLKTGRRWALLVGGVCYGLLFYTYLPARFTPLALLVVGVYAWRRCRVPWRALALLALAAGVVLVPLGVLTFQDPDLVLGRTGQVAVWSAAINLGDFPGALLRHTLGGLGMFVFWGDTIPRHNLPGRPVFDPVLGLLWLAGVVLMARAARRGDVAAWAALAWMGTMLLPTVLAEDAPHFLRAVGVLPVVVLPAAYVLARVRREAALLVVAVSLGWTVYDYFGRYLPAQQTALAFDHAATALAAEVNAGAQAVVDWRLWARYPAVRYLTAAHPAVSVYYDDRPAPILADDWPLILAAWPYEPQARLTQFLPAPARVAVTLGPEAIYAPEAEPFALYAAYRVQALAPEEKAPLVVFDAGMALVQVWRTCADDVRHVVLDWQTRGEVEVAYTALVHLDDGRVYDAPPGTWVYPTPLWRPGDVIRQTVRLGVPCGEHGSSLTLTLGLYNIDTGDRLPVEHVRAPAVLGQDNTVSVAFGKIGVDEVTR